ncbi:MAG: hypothetical protein MRK02_06035 [Candidatus Scalindua sp.]|nr:hypothetical protein [Candidatus Scalindua sp.]
MSKTQNVLRFLSFVCTISLLSIVFIVHTVYHTCESNTIKDDFEEIMALAHEILAERYCPCQCGRFLPGSHNSPACFGCSVGKNEISYVLESLEDGKKPQEIIMDLNSPITISIFADWHRSLFSKNLEDGKKSRYQTTPEQDSFKNTRIVT